MPKQKKIHHFPLTDKILRVCLYAIPVIVPAIFLMQFYTSFSAPKLLALQLITLIMLAVWGYQLFMNGKFTYYQSGFNKRIALLLIVLLIATATSVNIWTSLLGIQGRFVGFFTMLHMVFISYAAYTLLRNTAHRKILLTASFAAASTLAIYGITQAMGLGQGIFNWTQDPTQRVFGTLGHSTHFALYLGMNLLIGAWLIPAFKQLWQRWLIGAGIALQIVTIILTGGRGALIATVLAGIITAIIFFTKHHKKSEKKGHPALKRTVLAIITLLALAGIITAAVPDIRQKVRQLPLVQRTAELIGATEQGRLPDRVSWWASSLQMFADRPFFGHGLATFSDAYNQYRRTDYKTLEPGDMQDTITPESAHNEYLNILATQGLAGFLTFLAILLWVVKSGVRQIRADVLKEERYLLTALLGAVLVYALSVVVSFGVITTLTMFWLFTGALAAAVNKNTPWTVTLGNGKKYIISGLLLLLIAFGFTGAIRSASAEIFYKSAVQAVSTGDVFSMLDNFESAVQMNPWEYEYQQKYGVYAFKAGALMESENRLGLFRRAESAYREALKLNPLHPSTWYNVGKVQLQLYAVTGDLLHFEDALTSFDHALENAVNNPLYPYEIGKELMLFSTAEARQAALNMLQKAQQIRPNYRDTETRIQQLQNLLTETKVTPSAE